MKWFAVSFDDAMTHAVPHEFVALLVDDLRRRGHPIKDFEKTYGRELAAHMGGNPKAITEWAFDCGGGYIVGMPAVEIELDGLAIEVTCDHVGWVLADIRKSELRHFADGTPYYKFRFWHHATVVTPAQRHRILFFLHARLEDSDRRADVFIKQWQKNVKASDATKHTYGCACDQCERARGGGT